ncbi:MAG TPA: PqqD family protein [Melioribacteraceae bacterium]|nr:PqqD family protein [Melioribacteraceae bacterium]
MPLSFSQRRRILKNANYLDLRPLRLHKDEIGEDNIVTILIPKFKNRIALKYIVPKLKSPEIKLKLDEIGSQTWLLLDGKKTVREISSILLNKFGEKIEPVNQRLTKFLTGLYEQRLITFQEINL